MEAVTLAASRFHWPLAVFCLEAGVPILCLSLDMKNRAHNCYKLEKSTPVLHITSLLAVLYFYLRSFIILTCFLRAKLDMSVLRLFGILIFAVASLSSFEFFLMYLLLDSSLIFTYYFQFILLSLFILFI